MTCRDSANDEVLSTAITIRCRTRKNDRFVPRLQRESACARLSSYLVFPSVVVLRLFREEQFLLRDRVVEDLLVLLLSEGIACPSASGWTSGRGEIDNCLQIGTRRFSSEIYIWAARSCSDCREYLRTY